MNHRTSIRPSLVKMFASLALAFTLFLAPARTVRAQQTAGHDAASGESATTHADSPTANEEEKDENDVYKHSASVKKLGSLLGLSTERAATVFEVGNFVILVALLGLLIVKTLPKVFRDRNSAIQKDLVDARTATEEANLRLGGVESRLAKLDEEIAAMRLRADQDSALDEQRIKASAEDEKKKILAAAEQEIAAATVQARRQLQQYAAELAIEQAARKLVISAETDRLLVQNFARRLGGDDSKEGQN